MTTETETLILTRLEELTRELRSERENERWPKTPEQFADYVGRSTRTVQDWIDKGLLRANTSVKPALITRGNAERFLEGGR